MLHQVHYLTDGGLEAPPVGFNPPSEQFICPACRIVLQNYSPDRNHQESGDCPQLWLCSGGGSLYLECNDAVPAVVLSGGSGQSLGAGCSGTPIAKQPPVCLSSSYTTNVDASKDRKEQLQSAAGCSILAGEDLVPNDLGPWALLQRKDLLSQLQQSICHLYPEHLCLHLWPLKCQTPC